MMLLAMLAAATATATPSADTVIGTWKTQTRNGTVEVAKCGSSICGTIVTSDLLAQKPDQADVLNKDQSLRGRKLKGLQIVQGGQWDGSAWSGGTVYNPDDGRTYSGKITPIDADHLKLRGCVFVPLCKTETWTRIH